MLSSCAYPVLRTAVRAEPFGTKDEDSRAYQAMLFWHPKAPFLARHQVPFQHGEPASPGGVRLATCLSCKWRGMRHFVAGSRHVARGIELELAENLKINMRVNVSWIIH